MASSLSFSAAVSARPAQAPRAARREARSSIVTQAKGEVTLLDYGAGNVRSVRNAIRRLGYTVKDVERPEDILKAERLVFPGVGSYGPAMDIVNKKGYAPYLKEYINEGRSFLGICLGLQLLFEGSEENGGCEGLGLVPGRVLHFDRTMGLPIPHIGWNTLEQTRDSRLLQGVGDKRVYFVHSYRAAADSRNADWVLSTTEYGERFVSAINKGEVYAAQFHPEKSGTTGLEILESFLDLNHHNPAEFDPDAPRGLAKRVIACLDVRSNDAGDLVVTKGDQYDVREKDDENDVRNLGAPVDLCGRYFEEGADEVTFLNITGFRDFPLDDLPMLEVLQRSSETVFVPLTVGGGIRGFTDANGKTYSALDVATAYFRAGADKISIGSDAVLQAEQWYANGSVKDGSSSIEQISQVYGAQAVVVSIDPKRVYVEDPSDVTHTCVETAFPGPNGEKYCWWQCTIKGGREGRDLGAEELAVAVEALGAGEILLNCIDKDGQNNGFDCELVETVSTAVSIPVIASSGAGKPEHFTEVFNKTHAAAALAAGIFHRREVGIDEVKHELYEKRIPTRL